MPSSFLALARSARKGAKVAHDAPPLNSALRKAPKTWNKSLLFRQPVGKLETAHSFVQVLLHVGGRLKTGSSRVKRPAANFASKAGKEAI